MIESKYNNIFSIAQKIEEITNDKIFEPKNFHLIFQLDKFIQPHDFRDIIVTLFRNLFVRDHPKMFIIFFRYIKEFLFDDWLYIFNELVKTGGTHATAFYDFINVMYAFLRIDFVMEMYKRKNENLEFFSDWAESYEKRPWYLEMHKFKDLNRMELLRSESSVYFCFEEITEKLVSEGATRAEKIEGNNPPSTWFWLNK